MAKLEDGLYSYILTRPKIFGGLCLFIIVGILGSVLKYYPIVFSDQNLSYYLFSTIVQGFLALVGFLGALVIFKLQNLETDLSQITNGLRTSMRDFTGSIVDVYSSIEMLNETNRILQQSTTSGSYKNIIAPSNQKLRLLFDEKSQIKKLMVDFSLWSFANISLALIGIPFSRLLVFYRWYLFIGLYSIINISVSLGSLFAAFVLIKGILGYLIKK